MEEIAWGRRINNKVLYRESQRDVVCLCWPIAPSYVSPNGGGVGGGGGVAGSQPMSTAVHITWHGAQINLGDLPQYLTYGFIPRRPGLLVSCMQVQEIFAPLPIISRRTLSLYIYLSQWLYITLPSTLFNGLALVKSVMTTSPFILLRGKFPRGTAYF
jgi:hypothetical protein